MFEMSYGRAVYEHQSAGHSGSMVEEELSPACVAWKKELQRDLQSVQTVGEIAIQRIHKQFVSPGLEIRGCLIPLPLDPSFAGRIKGVASPAHLPREASDVAEHSSSLIWELEHDKFRIVNPSWPAFLESLKQDAAHGLGLDPSKLIVAPEKLMLYEKNSFLTHQNDSEREPGVIGRLVISLPSEHEGGQVHLGYAATELIFTTAVNSAFDLSSLAWYSDATHEVKEIISGHRLDLIYSIIQTSDAGKSAGFFVKQQAQLKERITRWPGNLSKLAHFLDHNYPQASLTATNLKQRDRAVFELLSPACSDAGICLLLGNITRREDDQCCGEDYDRYDEPFHGEDCDHDDEHSEGIYLDFLCTAEGRKIAEGVEVSMQHIVATDPYSNRRADSEDQGVEDDEPTRLRYHNSALVLIPRNKLHYLLDSGADILETLMLMVNEVNKNPTDTNIRADSLKFMDKALDLGFPPVGSGRHNSASTTNQKSASLTIVWHAWNLNDIPLYCKAIQNCTADGSIPQELPSLLAMLAIEAPNPQAVDWTKCLGVLLNCPLGLSRISAALHEFEKALKTEGFKDSFRTWIAPVKRTKFESKMNLTVDDYDFIEELASSLWHDDAWVEKNLMPRLKFCKDKILVSKFIKTLADKVRDNSLPGAAEAAKDLLSSQLQRLCLGPVNLLSSHDQQVAKEVDGFVDLVGACLALGLTNDALWLIQSIKPNSQYQQHPPGPHLVFTTSVSTAYVPNPAHRLVRALGDLLDLYKAPFMESLRGVFEDLLRNYALSPFPVYPTRPVGWEHQPRACNAGCWLCRDLDLFLTNPQQQSARFSLITKDRGHLEKRLPRGLFRCGLDRSRTPFTLVVYKMSQDGEYREAVAAYHARARVLREYARDFRKEHLRKILGDDLYSELVLLEGPPGSMVHIHPGHTAVGVKREAEEELVPPPRLHMRPWVM